MNPTQKTPSHIDPPGSGWFARNRQRLVLGLGILVTVSALYLTTRGIRLAEFAEAFTRFNGWWFLPGFVLFYYSMYLRAVRWGLLFRPHYRFKGYQVLSPLMICFGFNSILPGRVGEFMRAYLVGRRKGAGIPTAMATVVAERILDAVVLLGMLAACLSIIPPIDPEMKLTVFGVTMSGARLNAAIHAALTGSAVLAVGVMVFMIPWVQLAMFRLIRRLSFLNAGLRHTLENIIARFAQGFHALARPWPMLQIVFHSFAIWVLVGLSNMVVARGFNIDMNLAESMALVTLIGIAIVLPATPGYWGLYEAGGVFSMIVLGIVPADRQAHALAYILMIHLLQYLPIVAIGLFFAWREQVRPGEASDKVGEVSETAEHPVT